MEGRRHPRRASRPLAVEPLEDRLLLSNASRAGLPVQPSRIGEAATRILADPRAGSISLVHREILQEIRPAAAIREAIRAAERETAGHAEWHEGEIPERIEHAALAIARVNREEAAANSLILDRSAEVEEKSGSIAPVPLASEPPDPSLVPQPRALSAGPLADPALLRPHLLTSSTELLEPAIARDLAFLSEAHPIDADSPAIRQLEAPWLMRTGTDDDVGWATEIPLHEGVAFDLPEWQRTVADFLARLAALGDPQSTLGMSVWLVAVAIVGAGAALEAARSQNRLARRCAFRLANGWAPEAFFADES